MKKRRLILALFILVYISISAQQSVYWIGEGGSGIRITVSAINGVGLSREELHLLPLIQASISNSFQKYSAMTVTDQQNIENILNQQRSSLSADFSDADQIRIGRLTNARYVVFGSLTKMGNSFMLELAVSDIQTGLRVASFIPKSVTFYELRDFSAARQASIVLLEQLGINLTERALQELSQPELDKSVLDGADALARGRAAERSGSSVVASSYYFQASTYDPNLSEAITRVSTISTAVSKGNVGSAVLNRLQEHDAWKSLVENMIQHYEAIYPYIFIYESSVTYQDLSIDFDRRTAQFTIPIRIEPTDDWDTIREFRRGLDRARKNDRWDFNLQNIGPSRIAVSLQVVNGAGKVLWSQTQVFDRLNETRPVNATVTFIIREIENMDDLSIRVTAVNGVTAQRATETGMIRIIPRSGVDSTQKKESITQFSSAIYMRLNLFTNIQFYEEKIHNGIYKFIDFGVGFPLGGFTHAGLELGFGLYFDDFVSQGACYNISPLLGFAIPLGRDFAIHAQGLIDVGYFGSDWKGLLGNYYTPAFNVGFLKSFSGENLYTGWGLNYRGTWYEDVYTHGISLNIGGLLPN